MGKKSDYIQLNKDQKEEIRRLTQLANRRIRQADNVYKKAGMEVLPRDVVGEYQTKEKWDSAKNPISRSIKFTSQKEYRQQLHKLQRFERSRPAMKEYTELQRNKTVQAVETSLGDNVNIPQHISKKLAKLSAPELARFWNMFSDKAARLGLKYGSDAAMKQTIAEFFGEDIDSLWG